MIVQVNIGDSIARRAIFGVLNPGHNGKIKQSVLDFWRVKYEKFARRKAGGETIFLVAIKNSTAIGISCAAILDEPIRCFNSMTVVHTPLRKSGIGVGLLSAKIKLLSTRYAGCPLSAFVSKKNIAAVKMCVAADMRIIREGRRERDGKEATEFYEFYI